MSNYKKFIHISILPDNYTGFAWMINFLDHVQGIYMLLEYKNGKNINTIFINELPATNALAKALYE